MYFNLSPISSHIVMILYPSNSCLTLHFSISVLPYVASSLSFSLCLSLSLSHFLLPLFSSPFFSVYHIYPNLVTCFPKNLSWIVWVDLILGHNLHFSRCGLDQDIRINMGKFFQLSACSPVSLFVHVSAQLSLCSSVSLFTRLSVHPSPCSAVSVHLSLCFRSNFSLFCLNGLIACLVSFSV